MEIDEDVRKGTCRSVCRTGGVMRDMAFPGRA